MTDRYTLKDILARGGMGAVYRAYDNETRRDVTLKTLLDLHDRTMLDLFYRECQVLASLNHPNIVDIYDVGEMPFDGVQRPYFVMPLLSGRTLDELIATASGRLTPPVVVDILCQAARGLHAAHERGLVHRDIKPSNIFVMEDDSVKIIDFGVAHLSDGRTSTTLKGTLHYMAPEQLQMQKPTALTDLFSLGVVAYQAFSLKRPFEGNGAEETVQAILNRVPPAVSELNPVVPRAIGQVIHKAMAKQPYHRFANLREFSDCLQKALRGEPLDLFDETKILPRVERARRAADAGEFDFANEVLAGLEAEGYLHPDMAGLRVRVDEAVRSRAIEQRLGTARRFLEEDEFQLALSKTLELLQIDPSHAEGLTLKAEIERRRGAEQVTRWLQLAEQHAGNHSYSHARQALDHAAQLRPDDAEVRKLLSSVTEREQDYLRVRREKEQSYRAAREAWQRGDVSVALNDLERVLEMDRRAPETGASDQTATYQEFYNQVRSDHDAMNAGYQEARRWLRERNFKQAAETCAGLLKKYPQHALFQALQVDIEQEARQDQSAFIARIDAEVDQERDLDRRIAILDEALKARPGEEHFSRALSAAESKRNLVKGIVDRARTLEEKGQFQEALAQWEMLRSIYPAYPGLEMELERVGKQRAERTRSEAKRAWVAKIGQALGAGQFAEALGLVTEAFAEFPSDPEVKALEASARQGLERLQHADEMVDAGRKLCETGRFDEGLRTLREARALDESSPKIRSALVETLVTQARAQLDGDWVAADLLAREAAAIEPANPMARSLLGLLEDRKRAEAVEACVVQARNLQADENLQEAMTAVTQGLASFPEDQRLLQLRMALEQTRTAMVQPGQLEAVTVRPAAGPVLPKSSSLQPDDAETMLAVPTPLAALQKAETVTVPIVKPASPVAAQPAAPVALRPATPAPAPATEKKKPSQTGLIAGGALAAVVLLGLVAFRFLGNESGATPAPASPKPAAVESPIVVSPPPVDSASTTTNPPPIEPAVATGFGSLLLTVPAEAAGFTLLIDGRALTGIKPAGPNKYLVAGLGAGRHKVAVLKEGFRAEPESLIVAVAENQAAQANFKMIAKGPGRWVLHGARPGTQVFLAGGERQIATVDSQGNASGDELPAGWQELELRLKGYHRRTGFRVNIKQGQEAVMTGPDPQLERIEVLLQLQGVEPRTAGLALEHTRFELKYDGPAQMKNFPPQMKLPPGIYNLTFSAPDHESETITVELRDYPLAPKVKLRKK